MMTKLFENEKVYSESSRAVVIEQVLKALNYMHTNNLVHRDLKPDNIIFANNKQPIDFKTVEIKVIDFGFAKTSKSAEDLDEFLGTPLYLAPEIILH
jgi:calcium-dependent protein kinase